MLYSRFTLAFQNFGAVDMEYLGITSILVNQLVALSTLQAGEDFEATLLGR